MKYYVEILNSRLDKAEVVIYNKQAVQQKENIVSQAEQTVEKSRSLVERARLEIV